MRVGRSPGFPARRRTFPSSCSGHINSLLSRLCELNPVAYTLELGIRIIHINPACPDGVIFYSFVGRDRLLQEIERVGFVPSASAADLPERRGMPWRWAFLIACLVVWNVLFFLDGSPWERHAPGGGAILQPRQLFSRPWP